MSQLKIDQEREIDSGLERLNQAGFAVVRQRLTEFDERDWAAEATCDQWVGLYMRNICAHYHEILAAPTIARVRDVARGAPAAVVGAGPSLDKNVEHLRDFPGLIVATDRAAIPLVARGIRPDLVVSVDPHIELIAHMLDFVESNCIPLALSVCCDPEVSKVWHGPKLYMSHLNPGTQFFDRILPEIFPGMAALDCLGNVGNTAVQLAAWMGCGRIVLVGQDYAYTDGKMHADEWEYDDQDQSDGDGAIIHYAEGWGRIETDHVAKLARRTGKVDVDGVTTYAPFLSYRDTLMKIRDLWNLDIVNATEGGILTALPQATLEDEVRRLRDTYPAAREARTLLANATRGER